MNFVYGLLVLIAVMAFVVGFLGKLRKMGEIGSRQLGKAAVALMKSYEDLQGLTRAISFQNDDEEAKLLRDQLAPFEPEKMDLTTKGIQQALADFLRDYNKAMELKQKAKTTGDLTHYEKKLAEDTEELQNTFGIYNKTANLYNKRSHESPYNVIRKIIPIRAMGVMEIELAKEQSPE